MENWKFSKEDLDQLRSFNKIVDNYLKMMRANDEKKGNGDIVVGYAFFCFKCGSALNEVGMGLYHCGECTTMYLPSFDPETNSSKFETV